MIDIWLLRKLLKECSAKTHIVLLGDADQLGPISAGQPFADMIAVSQSLLRDLIVCSVLQKAAKFPQPRRQSTRGGESAPILRGTNRICI
jgi:ATP-dependent exoDNAse (exonuclease V) alpha subunit